MAILLAAHFREVRASTFVNLATIYRIAYESQGILIFDDYFASVWCVVITMMTVGYGDVAAVSYYGRMISMLNALWGAFIISCLVASIGKLFEVSHEQKSVIREIKDRDRLAA